MPAKRYPERPALKLVTEDEMKVKTAQGVRLQVGSRAFIIRRMTVFDASICKRCARCGFIPQDDGQGMCAEEIHQPS